MSKNQQVPMEKLLEGVEQHTKFLYEEELKAELQARGIEVDAFLHSTQSAIANYLKADRLTWMKIADEKKQWLAGSKSDFGSWLSKGEVAIRSAWAELLRAGSECAVAFRNKKDLTIEDMAKILDDHERLRSRR